MSEESPIQGRRVRLGPETNTTPVAGGNDTVIGANSRRYTVFTLPTSSTFYSITGIEWLNGTVVNGNTHVGIEIVDANPPVSVLSSLVVWGTAVQTGTSAVQRLGPSLLSAILVPGGSVCGAFILTGSATGRYGTTTVGSKNNSKSITAGADQPISSGATSWTATTEEPYIKVYYKAVL